MNEVEDGFQIWVALQRHATALLPAHYSASIRSQRLDLGIKVLMDSKGAGISYPGLESVLFECACSDMCSIYQNRPKVNTYRKLSERMKDRYDILNAIPNIIKDYQNAIKF